MNRGREGHGLTEPGEEYIPADFIPRVVSRPLALIRLTMFGSNPDRLFLNYRMRQFMQLLHATQLSVDVTSTDPRITYLPFKSDLFDSAFKVTIAQPTGQNRQFDVIGTPTANMSSGFSQQSWNISVGDAGLVTVVKRRGASESNAFYLTADTPVPLAGSDLKIFLHGAPSGTQLSVESTVRPVMDVADVLNGTAAAIGQYGVAEIFPTMPSEPVATWKRIWDTHPHSTMKFAAMLLAIAYRTAQLPQEVQHG